MLSRSSEPVLGWERGHHRVLDLSIANPSVPQTPWTVCVAKISMGLDPLPAWVTRFTARERVPLTRILRRAGARLEQTYSVQPARIAAGPEAPVFIVEQKYYLNACTDPVGHVSLHMPARTAELRACPGLAPVDAMSPTAVSEQLDSIDSALVALLRRRALLAAIGRCTTATPPVYDLGDDLLVSELVDVFGRRRGCALYAEIIRAANSNGGQLAWGPS